MHRMLLKCAAIIAAAGMINAIGLENPGVDAWIEGLPEWAALRRPVIVSVGGNSPDQYAAVVRALEGNIQSNGHIVPGEGCTEIFIRPGFSFQAVDAMITNFHLPQSTLLVLVSAFAGRERILHAYREAVANAYRFFSFGDAMFLEQD